MNYFHDGGFDKMGVWGGIVLIMIQYTVYPVGFQE
jgi:hypothetical protein